MTAKLNIRLITLHKCMLIIYKIASILESGLAIIALFLYTTIGRSISIGCATIAEIIASFERVLPLKFSIQIDSLVRIKSIGERFNFWINEHNSS